MRRQFCLVDGTIYQNVFPASTIENQTQTTCMGGICLNHWTMAMLSYNGNNLAFWSLLEHFQHFSVTYVWQYVIKWPVSPQLKHRGYVECPMSVQGENRCDHRDVYRCGLYIIIVDTFYSITTKLIPNYKHLCVCNRYCLCWQLPCDLVVAKQEVAEL